MTCFAPLLFAVSLAFYIWAWVNLFDSLNRK